jgi:hypothetical protein
MTNVNKIGTYFWKSRRGHKLARPMFFEEINSDHYINLGLTSLSAKLTEGENLSGSSL